MNIKRLEISKKSLNLINFHYFYIIGSILYLSPNKFWQNAIQDSLEEAVALTAVRTVTWPGDVTDLQGSVTEGVKRDGQEPRVIRVLIQLLLIMII